MKPKLRKPGDLAKLLGVRVERRPTYTPLWDGRALNIHGLNEMGYVHELMHWLLATPFRRSLPNFGHGSTCEDDGAQVTLTWEKRRFEEMCVGVMSRACLKVMGRSDGCDVRESLAKEVAKATRDLTRRGLLDKRMRPALPGLTYEGDE